MQAISVHLHTKQVWDLCWAQIFFCLTGAVVVTISPVKSPLLWRAVCCTEIKSLCIWLQRIRARGPNLRIWKFGYRWVKSKLGPAHGRHPQTPMRLRVRKWRLHAITTWKWLGPQWLQTEARTSGWGNIIWIPRQIRQGPSHLAPETQNTKEVLPRFL